jgi:TPP-dependent pyruvate/acetoin dehydrogenase alpha subunit
MLLTDDNRIELFTALSLAMALDRLMMRLIRSGRIVGFYHEGGIALAPGVAAGFFLKKDDAMWPHYRGHGLAHMVGKRVDVQFYIAEHMGREAGCCKGRSSYHMSFPDDHIFGFSGNIGANFPVSVGYGLAAKRKAQGQIVMNCSGDGSYGEGRSHEALLVAANWKLPIVFWCESNGMAQHSDISAVFPRHNISDLAGGFGIESHIVDGQDLFACAEMASMAVSHVRSGKGPIFIECKTLRAQEHSVGGVNYAGATPRDPKLMGTWKEQRHPLTLASNKLLEQQILTPEQVERIYTDAEAESDRMEAFAEASPKALPSIEEMLAGVYSE